MADKNSVEMGKDLAPVPNERAAEAADLVAGQPTGRALDAAVAERVMGFTRAPEPPHPTDNRQIGGVLYYLPGTPWDRNQQNVVPYFSTDIAAAMEVENRIAELGLEIAYAESLWLEVNQNVGAANNRWAWWNLARATAEQRCRAALQATEPSVSDATT